MAEFIEAGRLEDVPPGKGRTVTIAGKEVALFNVDGTIYAMDDSASTTACRWEIRRSRARS